MSFDTTKIQHLLNNINLGTSEAAAGDYLIGTVAGNVKAAAAVAPIASPSTATTQEVATALNALITALGTLPA